ncbi:MAG: HAMP domain-containing sensor histidine kinase, partial [Deltaproteobacteria bacterium]|nr:HAMP domain-containing sensor histidine kinase [Deltaproteobacteria bacterium]
VGTDEEFQKACVYRFGESIGVFKFVFQAMSPLAVYNKAMAQMPLISRYSRFEVVASGRTFLEYKYFSTKKESRLTCLSRQAQGAVLPTLWGLPRARVVERKCLAFGDDCCELTYQWYEYRRLLPMLAGLAAGGAAGFGLSVLGLSTVPLWLALPLIGGLVGYVLELRRTNKANLVIGEDMNKALVGLAGEDADARREVMALHQRQKEWTRMLEEQVAERTANMEDVVRKLQSMRESFQTNVRGMSHDLQSPLLVIHKMNEYMLDNAESLSPEFVDCLNEQRESLDKMSAMFKDLMSLLRAGAPLLRLAPQMLETEPLLDQLRRRIRALVIGREIRVSTLATRETPAKIETDRLLFDRVIDNLLTNAAKYTERGSIVIELDGKPGFFTIKVSDTGRGIVEDDIRKIFEPGGSAQEARARYSHGVGLSVMVRLLAQIGGKLEVMSRPDMGTTFWAHFPVEISKAAKEVAPKDGSVRDDDPDILNKVVTIHRSKGR